MDKLAPLFARIFFSFILLVNVSYSQCDNTPGLADSHVLALSWQPGFCEAYGARAGKPECKNIASDAYAINHLVLHGLWPNQKACGIRYGYCGVREKKSFCSYQPLVLGEKVSDRLEQFMPSYAHGSCLERHEWNKHGACQVLSQDGYFSLAMRLNEQFNQSKVAGMLYANVGQSIPLKDLMSAFEDDYGEEAKNNVYFSCRKGMLVEVWLTLPALIPESASLAELLIQEKQKGRRQGCPKQVRISDYLTMAPSHLSA